nr:BRO-2 [Apis mellifera nudivirus]
MSLVKRSFFINNNSACFDCWICIVQKANGMEEYWFKAKDVADYLGYSNTKQAIASNVHETWRTTLEDLQKTYNLKEITPIITNTMTPTTTTTTTISQMLDDVRVCGTDPYVINPSYSAAPTSSAAAAAAAATTMTAAEAALFDPIFKWHPQTVLISEPGLYALVTRSKKIEAVQFTRWIYEDVLPSLRRTGSYSVPSATAAAAAADSLLVATLKDENEKIKSQLLQSAAEKMEIISKTMESLCLVKRNVENQLIQVKDQTQQQIEQVRNYYTEEINRLLHIKDTEIVSLKQTYEQERKHLYQEFKTAMVFGIGKAIERLDDAEIRAEIMEERAVAAEAFVDYARQRLNALTESGSIAPTQSLRTNGLNSVIVLFSEARGQFYSVSRIQERALARKHFIYLGEDGKWVANHPNVHTFVDFAPRRLLLQLDVANAVGSWSLIRRTNVRLYFGTHRVNNTSTHFAITNETALREIYKLLLSELNLSRNRRTSRLLRFERENFINIDDFVARCQLLNEDALCECIRNAVKGTTTNEEALVWPNEGNIVATTEPTLKQRWERRKEAREETMKQILADAAANFLQ